MTEKSKEIFESNDHLLMQIQKQTQEKQCPSSLLMMQEQLLNAQFAKKKVG